MRMFAVVGWFLLAGLNGVLGRSAFYDDLISDASAAGYEHLESQPEVRSRMAQLLLMAETMDSCQYACDLLSILVPDEVTAHGKHDYQPLAYWSAQQSEVTPTCRVDVQSARSIATALKVSRLTQCPFAVKSGGHAAFAGGSSIENGILLNLGPLNMVKLSQDRKTTSVGSGNKWYDVYRQLDPLGVSVVGGREAGVGVGGLTLGGGISYFSGRYGWACDNVRNYEVVLVDGRIVNASLTSHPDLYWALRGGAGTSFGIVSRFDLATFEQGLLWGGGRYYGMPTNASLADAFANFNEVAHTDPFAHLYIAFVYAHGSYLAVSGPAYGKPTPNPPIFDELTAIPSLVDATSIANMTTLSVELNQTDYLRQTFKTVTFKNDATLIKKIIAIYVEETNTIITVPGLMPAFAFQPISSNIIEQMSKNGGNALGIKAADGPLTLMNLNFGWSSSADDAAVYAATGRIIARSTALAQSMGLHHPFIYMNYATLDQDVYSGYGEESKTRLEKVRKIYDPQGELARLWGPGGYFKL